jgi:FixJ family two-component response regulator
LPEAPLVSIVDDDAWARDGIRDLVLSLGYRALTFASAQQFIDSGCIGATSCLITDLQMPGLNGFDLQQRLQTAGHRTPIIFVTAYPEERHRARALNAGAIAFLTKPFDEQSLVDSLAVAVQSGLAGDGPGLHS